jgi:hypothetical protein
MAGGGLCAQDVINRIAGLEAMGRLTGVMDDRGKYIYVSNEEMAAVAHFIQTSGRVSIANLAAKSNEFVDLSGPQAVELVRPRTPHTSHPFPCPRQHLLALVVVLVMRVP